MKFAALSLIVVAALLFACPSFAADAIDTTDLADVSPLVLDSEVSAIDSTDDLETSVDADRGKAAARAAAPRPSAPRAVAQRFARAGKKVAQNVGRAVKKVASRARNAVKKVNRRVKKARAASRKGGRRGGRVHERPIQG